MGIGIPPSDNPDGLERSLEQRWASGARSEALDILHSEPNIKPVSLPPVPMAMDTRYVRRLAARGQYRREHNGADPPPEFYESLVPEGDRVEHLGQGVWLVYNELVCFVLIISSTMT